MNRLSAPRLAPALSLPSDAARNPSVMSGSSDSNDDLPDSASGVPTEQAPATEPSAPLPETQAPASPSAGDGGSLSAQPKPIHEALAQTMKSRPSLAPGRSKPVHVEVVAAETGKTDDHLYIPKVSLSPPSEAGGAPAPGDPASPTGGRGSDGCRPA